MHPQEAGAIIRELDEKQVNLTAQGLWSSQEMALHINLLEMRAVFLSLQQLLPHILNKTILVRSDNTTVCSYITKLGGTKSPPLCQEVTRLLDWCWTHGIHLTSLHIPGDSNFLADVLSRQDIDHREWSLHQRVVNCLFKMWDTPVVDLFASIHNKKIQNFCSLLPCQHAVVQDAFTLNWANFSIVMLFLQL